MPLMNSCLSFIVLAGLSQLASAQDQSAQFNQVVSLNGNMQLNRITFPDNSKIETFSQTQRQLIVNQNPSSLSANHVVGSTGGPFVQLSQNSMTIATNNATDLVGAQIELTMDPAVLSQNNITPDNTFVAMLSPDRQTWIVMEGVKSVNSTDSTVRMVKMTNIDGEYMAIGRQTTETNTVLNPFGSKSVNISGSGIQEAEFSDGFRMSVRATQPMTVTANVVNGISTSMTPNGIMSVNNFRYLVQTNLAGVTPGLNQMVAVVQLPTRLMQMAAQMGIGANGSMVLGIAQRGVIQNPGGATGSLSPQKRAAPKKASSSSLEIPSKTASKVVPSSTADASTSSETLGATGANSTSPDASATDSNSTVDASGSAPSSNSSSPASSVSADGASPTDASASAAPASQESGAASQQQPQTSPSSTTPQAPAATQLLLSPTFTPINGKIILDQTAGRVAVPVTQLNGEFVLTMGNAGTSSTQSQPQPMQPAPARRRRQLRSRQNAAPDSQSGVVLSMSDLQAMVQRERNGGAAFLPGEMMDEFMQQSDLAGSAVEVNP